MGKEAADSWQPPVVVDLDTINPQALESALDQLKAYVAGQALPPLSIQSGWHTVTPQIALDWLCRNRANRRVTLAILRKYARNMAEGRWKKTGQGIVFDCQGKLLEGQHRLLACLFSGATFTTYVVTGAADDSDIFAYIDNGKPRSPADALYTSGSNGCSQALASAVKIAVRYEAGGFKIGSMPRMPELEPYEVMDYIAHHDGMIDAAHKLVGNFKKSMKVVGHVGIATFFSWQVIERYGINELDRFLSPLGSGAHLAEDSPILALRDRLRSAGDDESKITLQQRLGLLIKAFGMHYRGEIIILKATRKRNAAPQQEGLFLADNEEFPQFPPAEEMAEAA